MERSAIVFDNTVFIILSFEGRLLEEEIMPEFYDRNEQGIPTRWVNRVRTSMARLTPQFSTNRMMQEYVEKMYVPATAQFRSRSVNGAQLAKNLCQWCSRLGQDWGGLGFGQMRIQKQAGLAFEIEVHVGELDPSSICVELYANPLDSEDAVRVTMERMEKISGSVNSYLYRGSVPGTMP